MREMKGRQANNEHRPGMGTWEHQQVDKWVGRFLVLLAEKGHKPGFRYGKDLYLDMIKFFKVVAESVGVSPFDVAIGVAVRDLTRRED